MKLKNIAFEKIRNRAWWIGLMLIPGLLTFVLVTQGATYNFIFNNTEQGPNSSATPSIHVSPDGLVQKTAGVPAGVVSGATSEGASTSVGAPAGVPPTGLPQNAASVPQASSEVARTALTGDTAAHDRRWRFDLGLATVWEYGHVGDFGEGRISPSLGVSFFPVSQVGLHAFIGSMMNDYTPFFGGFEIELIPLQIGFGRFNRLIEAGLLAGVSSSSSSYQRLLAHAGARINVNLGEQWGLTTGLRLNHANVFADAGLSIRF